MANVIKNFLGYLKLNEDEEYDDYLDDYEEKEAERAEQFSSYDRFNKNSKSERTESSRADRFTSSNAYEEAPSIKKEKAVRAERPSSSKVVPIRKTTHGLEVCILKPSSFEDSQEICDVLLNGRAAVVNLEGFDPTEAQRIMDFVSGCVYAISGKLHQISKYIFIFSPDSIDISGDYLDLVPEEGFGVPTLNREF